MQECKCNAYGKCGIFFNFNVFPKVWCFTVNVVHITEIIVQNKYKCLTKLIKNRITIKLEITLPDCLISTIKFRMFMEINCFLHENKTVVTEKKFTFLEIFQLNSYTTHKIL